MAQNGIPPFVEVPSPESYELPNTSQFINKTNYTHQGRPVGIAGVTQGDINSNTEIAHEGTLLNDVERFLGIASGVIRRNNGQIQNINAVNNVAQNSHNLTDSEQHLSIIYQQGNELKWGYNQSMAFNQFKNMPFSALVLVTKHSNNGE